MRNRVLVQPFLGRSERERAEAEARRRRDPVTRVSRALYRSREWRMLRDDVLRRNPFCSHHGCRAVAEVVDHVRPHRGQQHLFFDPANLQPLCKHHHDRKTARFDGGFGRARDAGSAGDAGDSEPTIA